MYLFTYHRRFALCAWLLVGLLAAGGLRAADDGPPISLEQGFAQPPPEARLRAYWWWLNGNVTKESITRDLEGMKAQGFGGAVIFDADGSGQEGNARAPHGATFFSPEWRELYKHTLREADRLGLEISLNIQSGWNLGGPMIKPEDAPKKLVWSETRIRAGGPAPPTLPEPAHPKEFYRDVAVVAYPARGGAPPAPLKNLEVKALRKAIGWSAPDTHALFEELPARPGEEDAAVKNVVDLTAKMGRDGRLDWSPPAGSVGEWVVLRFGCTLNDHCRVSTNSEGWDGYALDPFDADVFRAYWNQVVEPLIADAGPLAGKTLRYLHTDSWEVETANWTPTLREEFARRRGYEMRPYLPVIAGKIIGSRDVSDRFLEDLRKTMGDLAVDNHYRLFAEFAHRHGIEIHPESGGPHAVPIDAQRCLGMDDAPMSEFWARSPMHRITPEDRFFVKQPASAAHTYGHRLVLAEGFTNIGLHWQETLWDNLKPSFDQAICEGLNRLVWHAFVCSPDSTGTPGQQYFAGTHFNPKTTWFAKSGAFLTYINRCQYLMQQGLPVADVLYYYGDHVPNFAQLRASDPAKIGAGCDYDVATEEVLLTRASVRGGRIVLPDGMSYAVLVLPDYPAISLPVLRKVHELLAAGATVAGPRPKRASGLSGYPESDAEVARLTEEMWGGAGMAPGKGRVIADRAVPEVLWGLGLGPDCEPVSTDGFDQGNRSALHYIHRLNGTTDIYFLSNQSAEPLSTDVWLRCSGETPELWDAVTGEVCPLGSFIVASDGPTIIPLKFAPYGSWFVVFEKGKVVVKGRPQNETKWKPVQELTGGWTVHFDPKWDGPATADFPELTDWTKRTEDGIRYYSGTATYEKTFDCPTWAAGNGKRVLLDLGDMHELAEVRLNGKSLGTVWAKPFQVDITAALQPAGNRLEIEITNFWPNRIIGDQGLPEAQRLTRTNIRKLTRKTPLMPSGLLGPVRIMEEQLSR